MTYKEYFKDSQKNHNEYHSQFVQKRTIEHVTEILIKIGLLDSVKEHKENHFNDVLKFTQKSAISGVMPYNRALVKKVGGHNTISSDNCVLCATLRIIRDGEQDASKDIK